VVGGILFYRFKIISFLCLGGSYSARRNVSVFPTKERPDNNIKGRKQEAFFIRDPDMPFL